MRVLLIAGGWSSEREVSLSGAAKIRSALEAIGHDVRHVDIAFELRALPELASDADFAFINLHGAPGEDGMVQALLDRLGLPYQGSGPAASFLALDKACAKILFEREGLPTPAWEFLPRLPGEEWETSLSFPVFVKPNTGGSSLGMSRARGQGELRGALRTIFAAGETALIEEAAPGPEITCGVLGEEPLPLILIRPKGDASFFDYTSKYTAGGAEEICPAPVPEELAARIQDLALRAHSCLGLTGCSRADFIMSGDTPLLLEVNTLPGMTATSLLPQAAAQAGYSFEALVARLIEIGLAERPGKVR